MWKHLIAGLINITIVVSMIAIYQAATAKALAEEQIRKDALVMQYQQLIHEENKYCLAKNIYFEARSESITAQRAVAWVTLNRVNDDSFPNTICGVVYQASLDSEGNPRRHQCQFSWYCDGKPDDPTNEELWVLANSIAEETMQVYSTAIDPTEGATYYHANYVSPSWRHSFERTVRIDTHIFYR